MEILTDDLDDGLGNLLVDDLDLPNDFVWQPRAQPGPTVSIHRHRPTRRRAEDHRHRGLLAGQLNPLPAPGETAHLVVHGGVPLSAIIWHIIDQSPPADLAISSLGFNRDFVHQLIDRMGTGQITSAVVVCSNYFSRADAVEYEEARALLRPWPCRLTDHRTHAKIAVFGPYSMEGSANLRSCRSIENVAITHDAALASFHAGWIRQLAYTPPNT
jgi:hypothetical protein